MPSTDWGGWGERVRRRARWSEFAGSGLARFSTHRQTLYPLSYTAGDPEQVRETVE